LALADGARLTKALCAGVQVGLKGRPQVLHPLAVVGLAQVLASSSMLDSDHSPG